MPPRTRRPAAETRAAIRDVAATTFLTHGYEASTLEQVAAQLGMTRPAVLYHFKSKEALLLEITEPAFGAISAVLDGFSAVEVPSAAQRRARLGALVAVLTDHRQAVALITRFTNDNTVCDIGATARRLNERAALALSGAAFETDPVVRVRTVACLHAMTGTMASRLPLPLETTVEHEALLSGLVGLLEA